MLVMSGVNGEVGNYLFSILQAIKDLSGKVLLAALTSQNRFLRSTADGEAGLKI